MRRSPFGPAQTQKRIILNPVDNNSYTLYKPHRGKEIAIMNSYTIPAALAAAVSTAALAQNGTTPAPVSDALSLSKFSFSEEINFFNLQNTNVTQFLSTIDWQTPIQDLSASLTMPVYTDGSTGAGMLDLGLSWVALHKPVSFVDTLSLALDLKLPTDSAGFGGDGVNPVLGAWTEGGTPVEGLHWNAGMNWEFNTDGDYIPVFGGFTTEDIANVKGGLDYNLSKTLAVGANYNFWYLDNGSNVNTIGPALEWTPCSNASLGFSCDIPFSNNNAPELELIVGFSAQLKF